MMLGSRSRPKSTEGEKTSGSAPDVSTRPAIREPLAPWLLPAFDRWSGSLLTSSSIGCPQWPHVVSMTTRRGCPRRCPCTKGVAIASTAQAASMRSPLLNVR